MSARDELREAMVEALPDALGWDWREEPGVPSVTDVVDGIAAHVANALLPLIEARDEATFHAGFDTGWRTSFDRAGMSKQWHEENELRKWRQR